MYLISYNILLPFIVLLNKVYLVINHHIITEMDRQSFTLKQTAIGGDVLLEIPRNRLEDAYGLNLTTFTLKVSWIVTVMVVCYSLVQACR